MKWLEVKVQFEFEDNNFAADLISNVFYDLRVSGVVIEESTTGLLDPETADLKPCPHDAVIGYIPKNKNTKNLLRFIKKRLSRLNDHPGIRTEITFRDIDEEDWAESWKAYFWPQKIGKHFVIKPTWRKYVATGGDIVLEIDPGMAFGTGTHPTTSMCLKMIEKYLRKGDLFLDIGTGSGILMVAAAKLGANRVVGVDSDDIAVEIAQKNLLLNNIEAWKFDILCGDLIESIQEQFHFVVANILAETIEILLDRINKTIKRGGIFVCSGIIEGKKEKILSKMQTSGFDIIEINTLEKWVAIAGRFINTTIRG